MSSNTINSLPRRPKLYQNDIVQVPKVTSGDSYAVVLRCWHDPEDIPPQAVLMDPLLRPLKPGEVGISYISHGEGREIVDESELTLIDRGMQPGDYCKLSIDDVRSGVVTAVKVKGRLAHVISNELIEDWKVTEDFLHKQGGEVGDYVIYNNWIGQIIEVFDESIVEVADGGLVRLPELGSRFATGDEGSDILPPSPVSHNVSSAIRSLFGSQSQNGVDKVINVRHTVYAVAWLALNQTLDVEEAASQRRPAQLWAGSDIGRLTLIRGKADIEMRVGDRVYLKDTTGLPMTEHGNEKDPAGIVHVQTFKVNETMTMVDVLWQDGIRETLKSTELIPYVSPDEYDCWPGDHVLWKAENQERFGVVQNVNPADRTACLLFQDTNTMELVSVLELDPTGTSDLDGSLGPHDTLGVRRGDYVFIHAEGTTNGMNPPKIPHIGELEPWVREIPIIDGQYTGWRKEMAELGNRLASSRASSEIFDGTPKRPDSSLHWVGEVTDLKLDGFVEVTHPDWTVKMYPLDRLTRLYDGMDQLEDDPWIDSASGDDDGNYPMHEDWIASEDSRWHQDYDRTSDEWAYDDVAGSEDSIPHCDCGEEMDFENADADMDVPAVTTLLADANNETNSTAQNNDTNGSNLTVQLDIPSVSVTSHIPMETEEWKRFAILPSAPVDHAFYSTVPTQPSKAFLGRLSKEYKALSSGLPDSIIVRAYEDRTDLLRSLIIGPENTPYQDAPFVIDWMLDSNFPQTPPVAFFLSWTNGNGRVNPNLYEDGKVCLSILGTWVGDQSETWSPVRSSLLQAFVSIQGLVLVKEPWFCEPAYDKLRGTEEGIVNSRLYSEKAYVLSRGFIRRALEILPGSLEEEIEWLYFTKGCLAKVLQDSRALIEKSKNNSQVSPEDHDLAIPRLTAGGIITLERTMQKLQDLYDRRQSVVAGGGSAS